MKTKKPSQRTEEIVVGDPNTKPVKPASKMFTLGVKKPYGKRQLGLFILKCMIAIMRVTYKTVKAETKPQPPREVPDAVYFQDGEGNIFLSQGEGEERIGKCVNTVDHCYCEGADYPWNPTWTAWTDTKK